MRNTNKFNNDPRYRKKMRQAGAVETYQDAVNRDKQKTADVFNPDRVVLAEYSLGNQPEKFQVRGDYLDYKEVEGRELLQLLWDETPKQDKPYEVALVKDDVSEVKLLLKVHLSTAAFPPAFFGSELFHKFNHYCKVSLVGNEDEEFVIPIPNLK